MPLHTSSHGSEVAIKAHLSVIVSTTLILLVSHRCPWLAENVSLAFPPCVGITFLFVLANFTMATFTDAGVLPRGQITLRCIYKKKKKADYD